MTRAIAHVLGLPALLVSIFVWGQTDDGEAGFFHHLPLLVNGAGFQSTLLVTNVADQANRCNLALLTDGLSSSSFEVHQSLTWSGPSATLDLPDSRARVSILGSDLPSSAEYGSATLDCELPAAARVLVTLRSENAVAAADYLPGAQPGSIFTFPVLPGVGDYLLAVHNGQGGEANCRVELANESDEVVGEHLLSIVGKTSVFRYLSELVQAPAGFSGGSATVSCDGQVAATGLLAGSALSGLPPVVLSNIPTAIGFAPVNSSAFDQSVVGNRFVSEVDSRFYTEFPAVGQFVEVEPGVRNTGTYTFSNTGSNTGTLTLNYSDGDTCTTQLTFTSATTGSSLFTCTGGETGGGNWRLDEPQPQTGNGAGTVTIPDVNLRGAIAADLGKAIDTSITVAEMRSLTRLHAQSKGIRNLAGLEFATNLTELGLDFNDISDLSALAGLTSLTNLSLRFNRIKDVSALGGLNRLTNLAVAANEITDVSMLGGLANLRSMNLDANRITDVSALGTLPNLTSLEIRQNAITEVSGVGNLTNVSSLGLAFNAITDLSFLGGLINLQSLDIRGNPLSLISIEDQIPVLEGNGVTVVLGRFPKGDFDIELVFVGDFIEGQKSVLHHAAQRWMSVIVEDLPDYEFSEDWSGMCGNQSIEIRAGERIDDLRIYVGSFDDPEGPFGYGGTNLLRDSHLPIFGCMQFNTRPSYLEITGPHEVGHVLGFGSRIWDKLGLLHDPDGDRHFNGPLAVAAFDDAGGQAYTGNKVPVEGSHWRYSVMRGELMGPRGGSALSAVTVQSMADLGYGVDVTQADAYTLPAATEASTQSAFVPIASP